MGMTLMLGVNRTVCYTLMLVIASVGANADAQFEMHKNVNNANIGISFFTTRKQKIPANIEPMTKVSNTLLFTLHGQLHTHSIKSIIP